MSALNQIIENSVHAKGFECSLQRDLDGRVFWDIAGNHYTPREAVANFVDQDWSTVYHDVE